VASITGK